jgi:uncharacterized protein (DUF58 family)
MKFSKTARWFLVLIIISGLAGWLVTGLVVYTRLIYYGLIPVVVSAIWTYLPMRSLRFTRKSRTLRASVGEVFTENFEIRKTAWPGFVWLEIVNMSNLPGATGSRLLTKIGSHQGRYYSARTLLTRRGAFLLGPTTLTSGDPIGFFSAQREFPATNTLVVLPMTYPISTFPPPPGFLPGGKTIRIRSMDLTPHAVGIREYIPSDPMKRIHWPSTAKRGRFMVKEFEQDPQANIWLFLDADRMERAYKEEQTPYVEENFWQHRKIIDLPCDTFEYGVSAAASLANFFLADRRAVGLACAAGKVTIVPAERGVRQMNKIMETLAFLQPEGSMPILGLVDFHAKHLPVGSGVILITSSSRPQLFLAIENLKRRNLRPVVVFIKSETFGAKDGSEKMIATLVGNEIPFCQISFGDDLGEKLALPAIYFQRTYIPKSFFPIPA